VSHWRYAVCVLAGVVAATWVRVVLDGRAELADGDVALAANDVPGALVHLRRAAAAYAPFASHVEVAYDRMRGLAQKAEGRGDYDVALASWRAVRAGSIGSRSILRPGRKQRLEADLAIARIVAAASEPAGRGGRSATDLGAAERRLLAPDPPPFVPWVLVRVVAVLAGVAAVAWMSRERLARGRLLLPLILLGSAMAVFVLGFWAA
jgi:hypothetical protein